MEQAIVVIIVVLAVAALMLVPIGIVLAVVWIAKNHQNKRLQTWGQLAHSKGLTLSGNAIIGYLHGQQVRVGTETRGSSDNRTTYTVVRAKLATPLDVGLEVRRHGWLSDFFESGHDIQVGPHGFDRTFRITGDEEHRVRAALNDRLKALLHKQVSTGPTFYLNDRGMVIERQGTISDVRWLDWALEVSSRATAKLEHSRNRIPVASGLAHHHHTWSHYAHAQGLHISSTPLCVWGRMDGAEVYVYTVRTAVRRYQVEVSIRFAEPLQMGLQISPKGLVDKIAIFFGSQDQRFDDPVFDDTFRVRCADPQRSQQLLTSNIRQRLLHLHGQLGPLTVSDEGISVRLPYVPNEPAMVPRIVHFMLELSEALLAALRDESSVGPYR